MTQDDIRAFFATHSAVHVQVAGTGDGSPEVAWGDTFIFVRDESGAPKKMPFATMVTKDDTGFDEESKLDRGGLYRLNLDVGRDTFSSLFGFAPKSSLGIARGSILPCSIGSCLIPPTASRAGCR